MMRLLNTVRGFRASMARRAMLRLLLESGETLRNIENEAGRFGVGLGSIEARSYYEILGIGHTDSQKAIKSAYIALVKRYHPDVSRERGARERMKEINEAYSVLKDRRSKLDYDRSSSKGEVRLGAHERELMRNELLGSYFRLRDMDVEYFNSRTAAPLELDQLRAAIDEFAGWRRRFGSAEDEAFGGLAAGGARLGRLLSANRRLLRAGLDDESMRRLRENERRLAKALESYSEMRRGIEGLVRAERERIGFEEKRIADELWSSV